MQIHKPRYEYVIYQNEQVIASGYKREIIKKMGITVAAFNKMTVKQSFDEEQHGIRVKGYSTRKVAVKVSVKELEEEIGDEVAWISEEALNGYT